MTSASSCPLPAQLEQLLLGLLPDDQAGPIEQHLLECDRCLGMTRALKVDDTLVNAMRAAPGAQTELARQEGISELTLRLRQMTASGIEPPTGEIPPGKLLGNYEILGKIGEGGMGVVYKAVHRRLERVVALKVLPTALTNNPEALRRFQREMKAVARLQHPHIVAAYDADEADGVHFLAMEYVAGEDLASHVRNNGPVAVDLAIDCLLQAAEGLAYAHSQGMTHRDIKPSNLLLSSAPPESACAVQTRARSFRVVGRSRFSIWAWPGSSPHRTLRRRRRS